MNDSSALVWNTAMRKWSIKVPGRKFLMGSEEAAAHPDPAIHLLAGDCFLLNHEAKLMKLENKDPR